MASGVPYTCQAASFSRALCSGRRSCNSSTAACAMVPAKWSRMAVRNTPGGESESLSGTHPLGDRQDVARLLSLWPSTKPARPRASFDADLAPRGRLVDLCARSISLAAILAGSRGRDRLRVPWYSLRRSPSRWRPAPRACERPTAAQAAQLWRAWRDPPMLPSTKSYSAAEFGACTPLRAANRSNLRAVAPRNTAPWPCNPCTSIRELQNRRNIGPIQPVYCHDIQLRRVEEYPHVLIGCKIGPSCKCPRAIENSACLARCATSSSGTLRPQCSWRLRGLASAFHRPPRKPRPYLRRRSKSSPISGRATCLRPKPDLHGLERLRFVTDSDYPPFHYFDEEGVLTGFNVDLAKAICEGSRRRMRGAPGRLGRAVHQPRQRRGRRGNRLDPHQRRGADQGRLHRALLRDARAFHRPQGQRAEGRPSGDGRSARRSACARAQATRPISSSSSPTPSSCAFDSADAAQTALKAGEVELVFGDGIGLTFWLNGVTSDGCCEFRGGPYLDLKFFGEGVGIAVKKGNRQLIEILNYGARAGARLRALRGAVPPLFPHELFLSRDFRLPLRERQPQTPAEPRRRFALIGLKPDGHAQLARFRLGEISPEQAVPERQVESVIAVMLAAQHRVMHPVHVRRDDEKPQHSVEPGGSAILAWLNMAQALRITSNRNTAKGEAPSGTTTTIFHSIDSAISIG